MTTNGGDSRPSPRTQKPSPVTGTYPGNPASATTPSRLELSTGTLEDGLYFINLTTGGKTLALKLVTRRQELPPAGGYLLIQQKSLSTHGKGFFV